MTMISLVIGEVAAKGEGYLVLLTGGVGFQIYTPSLLAAGTELGTQIKLFTHLVVREDLLAVYGFETARERDFFGLLLGVNGIGPKTALSCLSILSVDAIRRAVLMDDVSVFNRVPGVGKRSGQKIIIHLQGRLKQEGELAVLADTVDVDGTVLEALTSLGYSVVEAQAALQSIPRDTPKDPEERLRQALKYFST
jgi:Holliday junction DNA helicase RuvA